MAEYTALISWAHSSGDFLAGTYSREHIWTFDGGAVVPASPSPFSVRSPYSNAANVDPEEAFIAAISSCHMLTFLYLAYKQGFDVSSYDDHATGVTAKNEHGATWVSCAVLRPHVVYRGERTPTAQEERRLHHDAHGECYIANSVRTEITVVPA
jgi:organic hydroperoxide reductase OsmC/OhrA